MGGFKLALVELYLPLKHGIVDKKYNSLYSNYLILDTIEITEFYENMRSILSDLDYSKKMYKHYIAKLKYEMNVSRLHPFIRNYEKLVTNPKQYQLQIIEPSTYSIGTNEWDQYSTAVIKTHWIRLIQRRWREILKQRALSMKNIRHLTHREIHGRYPAECNIKFRLGI